MPNLTSWGGIPEMEKRVVRILGGVRERMEVGTEKAAYDLRDEVKRRAPVRTGRLRSAIYATRQPGMKPVYIVGIDLARALYGRFIEFGTSRMAAHPFVRPAIQAGTPKAKATLQEEMQIAVERSN
jgi:HK97 gp10 family phage protein